MDKRHTFEDPKSSSNSSSPSHSSRNHHHHNHNHPPIAADPNHPTALSAQDWLDTLSRAKELALSQSPTPNGSSGYSYSAGDDAFNNLSASGLSSSANTLDGTLDFGPSRPEASVNEGLALRGGDRGERGNTRAMLQKHHSAQDRGVGGDGDGAKGAKGKRFSKRQSKGVLAAVF